MSISTEIEISNILKLAKLYVKETLAKENLSTLQDEIEGLVQFMDDCDILKAQSLYTDLLLKEREKETI